MANIEILRDNAGYGIEKYKLLPVIIMICRQDIIKPDTCTKQ